MCITDVLNDCGYCRKLHREISQLNDFGIEVRYLAYPRAEFPLRPITKWPQRGVLKTNRQL